MKEYYFWDLAVLYGGAVVIAGRVEKSEGRFLVAHGGMGNLSKPLRPVIAVRTLNTIAHSLRI